MAKETNTMLGQGGIGFQGTASGSAAAMLKELQGLQVNLITGGAANTKFDLAAIRPEDTIISAINNAAGTLTDITANVTIAPVAASGTVTVGTTAAGDTVTVAGKTYTLVSNGTVVGPMDFGMVKVGATAAECATNLANAINRYENNRASQQVSASPTSNVVTVTAIAEGTSGNSLALAEVGTTFTVSGATLSGGTATGGIKSTSVTNQIMLFWFNKK